MSSFGARSVISIPDGMQERFKNLIEEALTIIEKNHEGVTQYEWYLSEDGRTCVVRETFASSEAAIKHIGVTAPYLSRLLDFATYQLDVYGEISDELREVVGAMKPTYYKTWRIVS